jgi:hypothetical protein
MTLESGLLAFAHGASFLADAVAVLTVAFGWTRPSAWCGRLRPRA